jgi:hypothetical protein
MPLVQSSNRTVRTSTRHVPPERPFVLGESNQSVQEEYSGCLTLKALGSLNTVRISSSVPGAWPSRVSSCAWDSSKSSVYIHGKRVCIVVQLWMAVGRHG